MPILACLLAALLACSTAPPEPQPSPEEVVERVSSALEDAAYQHGNGHHEDAVASWLEARQGLREELLPAIRETRGHHEAVKVEYLMGRVRAELDQPRGEPDPIVVETQELLRGRVP